MSLSTKDMSMKNIHGNLLLLFLLFTPFIHAQEHYYCSYDINSSKKSATVHEAVNISFTTHQKIHNEVMFFDLKPLPSDAYEIISIKEKRHEFNYHDAKKEFEFLLLPTKSGKIEVKFDFQVRRASDDAVAQAYTGSRDNVKSIPTIKVHIDTPTVELNIKKLPDDIHAVGDFNFSMHIDKESVSSYDKVNVVYTLQGRGFLDKNFEPIQKLNSVSIFRGIKEKEPRATKNGYIYKKEWSYALVADKNYTLPKVTLKTYNYRNKQMIDKTTQEKEIVVTKLDIESLLDDEESPNPAVDYTKYIAYFYNFLLFLTGFLVAKLLEYLPKKISKEKNSCEDIKHATTPKELLKYLTPYFSKIDIEEEILLLESLIYDKNSKVHFEKIKSLVVSKIRKYKTC